eukprot:GHVQ01016512.1.p1 GENE.GHVQ01016512.1~~GHVQ01016512.1.p1  ORF type:complete len:987 (+),score=235.28 GHVQ01016512.1:809-3769(+)
MLQQQEQSPRLPPPAAAATSPTSMPSSFPLLPLSPPVLLSLPSPPPSTCVHPSCARATLRRGEDSATALFNHQTTSVSTDGRGGLEENGKDVYGMTHPTRRRTRSVTCRSKKNCRAATCPAGSVSGADPSQGIWFCSDVLDREFVGCCSGCIQDQYSNNNNNREMRSSVSSACWWPSFVKHNKAEDRCAGEHLSLLSPAVNVMYSKRFCGRHCKSSVGSSPRCYLNILSGGVVLISGSSGSGHVGTGEGGKNQTTHTHSFRFPQQYSCSLSSLFLSSFCFILCVVLLSCLYSTRYRHDHSTDWYTRNSGGSWSAEEEDWDPNHNAYQWLRMRLLDVDRPSSSSHSSSLNNNNRYVSWSGLLFADAQQIIPSQTTNSTHNSPPGPTASITEESHHISGSSDSSPSVDDDVNVLVETETEELDGLSSSIHPSPPANTRRLSGTDEGNEPPLSSVVSSHADETPLHDPSSVEEQPSHIHDMKQTVEAGSKQSQKRPRAFSLISAHEYLWYGGRLATPVNEKPSGASGETHNQQQEQRNSTTSRETPPTTNKLSPTPSEVPGDYGSQTMNVNSIRSAAGAASVGSSAADRRASSLARTRGEEESTIWAIGDLHGDLFNTLMALHAAGCINEEARWIGGRSLLIQTGDVLDRGPDGKKLYDFFYNLSKEAEAAGGKVIMLLGNHDVMNLCGDFRYASEEETQGSFDGLAGRVRAFSPRGTYGMMLREFPLAVKVNQTVFVHAGILPPHAELGLAELTLRLAGELANDCARSMDDGAVLGNDGVVWTRDLSMASESVACDLLNQSLELIGAERMVVGHTVQVSGQIESRCGGKLVLIDTGVSRYVLDSPSVLQIIGGKFFEIKFNLNKVSRRSKTTKQNDETTGNERRRGTEHEEEQAEPQVEGEEEMFYEITSRERELVDVPSLPPDADLPKPHRLIKDSVDTEADEAQRSDETPTLAEDIAGGASGESSHGGEEKEGIRRPRYLPEQDEL